MTLAAAPNVGPDVIAEALAAARGHLLAARVAPGHWEGRLSGSALSTATAAFALASYASHAPAPGARDDCVRLSRAGLRWLVANQNADGGWGDTVDSPSNISTTALCWSALAAAEANDDDAARGAAGRADAWLARAAGGLEPAALADAIARRYGDDRTFSVPILTMAALAGRLGPREQAWRLIAQLPFELAALPQSWFRFVRLPVVSYALPALISMGLVRHRQRPTRNPLAGVARRLAQGRTLRVLRSVQPPGGGFLEATPLTSFVAMSLVAAGEAAHPVVADGVGFLRRSVRPDGSWPIDTNLATWVTTLSVNALGEALPAEDRGVVRDWLLGQQYRVRHPYTGAAPGGWAWTDLPGGVPDADDTAGALLALRNLGEPDARATEAACAGIRWLLDLQNGDGGIPTFCRGWGRLPFDRSAPELTAHALHAWSAWRGRLPAALGAAVDRAGARAVGNLRAQQRPDGSWVPLWFGNQAAPREQNPTHGTSRVVAALCHQTAADPSAVREMVARGVSWLLSAQNGDGGWGGDVGVAPTVEETGQAVQALAAAAAVGATGPADALAGGVRRGAGWLVRRTEGGRRFDAAPVGLYFANLWYAERLYPVVATVGALAASHRLSPP